MKTCRNNLKLLTLGATWAIALSSCSNQDLFSPSDSRSSVIVASIEDNKTRTAVDGDPVDGVAGLLWTDGDELGVFDENGNKHTRFQKYTEGSVANAEFGGGVNWLGKYAYYPYSEGNDGKAITSLTGTLPAEQSVGTGNIPADYKVGRRNEGTNKFVFTHLFSLVRLDLDATGTVLADEPLDYVKITAPSYIAGDFTFNLRKVTYSNVTNGSNTITVKWPANTTLSKPLSEYFSVMPTIGNGADLNFEVKTANYTARFNVTSKVAFSKEHLYNFPINFSEISKNYTITVIDKEGKAVDLIPGEQPVEPVITTGTFTCASMNVDGLSLANSDGPGADGTKKISQAIYNSGWDFFGVSEDFAYDTELRSALSGYKHGTFRGNVSITGGKSQNTDGLNFFWKEGISATNEHWEKYNEAKGGLTSGADEYIQKGFRHYEVTVAEGVVIDVYITHMNTYSGNGNTESNAYVKAVLSQLRQVRDYIVANAKKNNRPAIFMGDTNMRYTRHDIKTNLIDALNGNGITFNDPWVDFHRGGVFPEWNTKSLMIRSMFKGDKENDIACSDDQRGEVVDKIWYFNVPGAPLQLKATNLYNDVSSNFVKSTENASYSGVTTEDVNGNILTNQTVNYTRNIGIADHFPVVANFEWTLTK